MKAPNQQGLTLIELLAAMTLSSIILILIYSIFFSMIKSTNVSSVTTMLRNESVMISQQFDRAMVNVDTVTINGTPDSNGKFMSFTAMIKTLQESTSTPGVFTQNTTSIPVEIKNGNLLINNTKINSDGFTLQNAYFKLINGNLQFYQILTDIKSGAQFKIFKIYHLQGG